MVEGRGKAVLVTGAAGFIGRALVRALAARDDVRRIVAVDQAAAAATDPKVEAVVGDLAGADTVRGLLGDDVDTVFHLASLVSGGAERDYERGLRVNLDASRELLEAARRNERVPVFVFASSIAVYGPSPDGGPLHVDDDTAPAPRLSYGTHKLMVELLVSDMSRRGLVDGRSLRLPTVMVRDDRENTALSGWVSSLVREPLAGRDYTCPVQPQTQMACISVGKVVQALLHAASLRAEFLGADRTVLLEGLQASAAEILAEVRNQRGTRTLGTVHLRPDSALQALMERLPRSTRSARAEAMGFPRNASVAEIVAEYIATLG